MLVSSARVGLVRFSHIRVGCMVLSTMVISTRACEKLNRDVNPRLTHPRTTTDEMGLRIPNDTYSE